MSFDVLIVFSSCHRLNSIWHTNSLLQVFSKLDTDGNGTVSFEEFLEWFVMDKLDNGANKLDNPLRNALRQKLHAEKQFREVSIIWRGSVWWWWW